MEIILTNIEDIENDIKKILKMKKGNFLLNKNLGSRLDVINTESENYKKEIESYVKSALSQIKGLKINAIESNFTSGKTIKLNADFFNKNIIIEVNLDE